jgi:hypothetical protein
LPAGTAPGGTGQPLWPPRVPNGLASRPTYVYGPSSHARWRHRNSRAHRTRGHDERPRALVAWPFRPPNSTVKPTSKC